ncbi:MAG: D-amino acid aminotransferase [Phycisphaerales bacterium]|nr:D-amino acid aminotransferase [Phycisphaerales bacterium]
MSETWVYLNGQFLPRSQAVMDIEDRAAMFADGVYEVTHYYRGKAFAMQAHLDRLHHSLQGIEIAIPPMVDDLPGVSDELVHRNGHADGSVYWQVSRGPAVRKHVYPAGMKPTVLAISYPGKAWNSQAPIPTARVVLCPDVRWDFCCYKTLMLLPNAMAKNKAVQAGADEAVFYRGDVITEGSSTNVFAVMDGKLFTHPANQNILNGISRQIVIELATQLDIPVVQQAVSVNQLKSADEIIITGTTTQVTAITHIDGQPVRAKVPGPVTQRLHQAFVERICHECGLVP